MNTNRNGCKSNNPLIQLESLKLIIFHIPIWFCRHWFSAFVCSVILRMPRSLSRLFVIAENDEVKCNISDFCISLSTGFEISCLKNRHFLVLRNTCFFKVKGQRIFFLWKMTFFKTHSNKYLKWSSTLIRVFQC